MDSPQTASETWTVARLLRWTQAYFSEHKLDSPRLCAEILLAHVLGCERIELYTRHALIPDDVRRATYRELVRQAAAGRPIAYLVGEKEFFSLRFEVTPDVLIPRPETEVLVERVIHLAREAHSPIRSVLDVGTGSGCIAVSLAKNLPDVTIFASDIAPAALEVARRNARRHGVLERIEFRLGDLFAPWVGRAFDVIVSNPPYIARREAAALPANVREHEPHRALLAGEDGLEVIRRLVVESAAHLAPGGRLLMEVAWNQAAAVNRMLRECGWEEIVTHRDGLGHERVVQARRRAAETQVA